MWNRLAHENYRRSWQIRELLSQGYQFSPDLWLGVPPAEAELEARHNEGDAGERKEQTAESFLCDDTRRKIAEGDDFVLNVGLPFTDADDTWEQFDLISTIMAALTNDVDFIGEADVDIDIPVGSSSCKPPCVPVYIFEFGDPEEGEEVEIKAESGPFSLKGFGIFSLSVKWVLWEYCVDPSKLPKPNPDGNPTGGEHTVNLGGGQTAVHRCRNPSLGNEVRLTDVVKVGAIIAGGNVQPHIERMKRLAVWHAMSAVAEAFLTLQECSGRCKQSDIVIQIGPIKGSSQLVGYGTWGASELYKVEGRCRWYVERVCS